MMSFVKVINGPVARAGSIFNLLSNRGNAVPNKDANMITINKEVVTVIGMASDVKLKQSDKIKMIEEQMQAFMTAHEISFEMLWNIFFDVSVLEASPFTTIAEDWMPTFPPMAVITGMNMAVAGNRAMSYRHRGHEK